MPFIGSRRALLVPPSHVIRPDLIFWMDAGREPYGNGDAMTSVQDFSGHGNTGASFVANPTYNSSVAALGGLPAIEFTGGSQFRAPLHGFSDLGSVTVIIASVFDAQTYLSRWISTSKGTTGSPSGGADWANAELFNVTKFSGSLIQISSNGLSAAVTHPLSGGIIITADFPGAGGTPARARCNGNEGLSTTDERILAPTVLWIAGDWDQNYVFEGLISEVKVFSPSLSSGDMISEENAMKSKYALTF